MPIKLATLLPALLSAALFAQPLQAQQQRVPPTSPQTQQEPQQQTAVDDSQQASSKTTSANPEHIWLTANETPQRAFFLREPSGKVHGAVLLLPDTGRHPTTPGNIYTLRHVLADNHWHTLALDTGASSEENSQQLIAAGVAYLNQQGIFNIAILGEGIGAAQAVHYIAKLPAVDETRGEFEQIRALVMINAKNAIPGSESDTLKELGLIKQPILDAYSSDDPMKQQQANTRKRAAHTQTGSVLYRQTRLPLVNHFQQDSENRITKLVRGWLDNNITGLLLNRR